MSHLKRYAMPKWPIMRKERKFVIRPSPGPHGIKNSMPLLVFMRDALKYADTNKEAKRIISSGSVLVDKKPVKEPKFPIGFMDIIELPEAKEQYRIDVDRKGLKADKITASEASSKLCKVVTKKTVRGGKERAGLHDGRSVLLSKTEAKSISPGDSVLISLPDQKMLKHFKLKEGSEAMIMAGNHAGLRGKITSIKRRKTMMEKSTVSVSSKKGDFTTLLDYVFITGGGN